MKGRTSREQHAGHDRWLVSYADFITLLFAFFVVLYASAEMDKRKIVQISAAIASGFQQMGALPSGSAAAGLHEQTIAAGAVIHQRIHELGRHERCVAGLGQRVVEQFKQILARGGLGHEPCTDAGPQGDQILMSQQFRESPVPGKHHR